APTIDEQRRFWTELHAGEALLTRRHVGLDDVVERFFDGDGPFLAALAHDLDTPFAGPSVDGCEVEADQFGETQACEEGRGQEGEVPFRPRPPARTDPGG